jgi:demethylmenaquinone methyltransferase/2-methoxy-6-polyprenyl-1,4-benzoquinol methylase
LTIELAKQAGEDSEITGVDFNKSMLEVAEKKVKDRDIKIRPSFISDDAAELPFPDEYFDSVAISFAFRNLSYNNPMMEQYISEVLRVMKVGGRFVILETSRPKPLLLNKFYNIYMRYFIYWLGLLISGNRDAYGYLAESVVNYYPPEDLKKVLLRAGFSRVDFRSLFFSAVCIHTALK